MPVKGPPVSGPVYGPPRPVPLPNRYGPPPPLPPSRPFYPHKSPPVYEPVLEEKKPVVVVGGHQAGVQTHVHHHFHHDKAPLPVSGILEAGVIDTAPYPSAPSSSYGTPSFSPGPLYGNSIGPSGSGGLYSGSSSYGKPEFYKKQLNIKGSSSGEILHNITQNQQIVESPYICTFLPAQQYNDLAVVKLISFSYSIQYGTGLK